MSSKSNGTSKDDVVETQVMLLADTPAEDNQEVVSATAILIESAKRDALVAVICTHIESKQPATILCSLIKDEDDPDIAQYVPIAMLFTGDNAPWAAYQPPASAMMMPEPGPDPMTVFSDEPESD
jgi:hypothetical protein